MELLPGCDSVSGKFSGFTNEQKRAIDRYVEKHYNGGIPPPIVNLGNGRKISCPVCALRLAEIAEKRGAEGIEIIEEFLCGPNQSFYSSEELMPALSTLKEFKKKIME